jgi:hypothetical protein
LWQSVSGDAGFNAGLRLHESRAWAMNELTPAEFGRHVERGEVIAVPGSDALAILIREQLPSEDSALRPTMVVGGPDGVIALLERIRAIAGVTPRVRIATNAPLLAQNLKQLAQAGYGSPEWTMHVLGRRMDDASPLPEVDPARLILAETPDRLVPPRW